MRQRGQPASSTARTVFELDDRVPGYHTEYIDRPVRKCGSGQVTEIGCRGGALWSILSVTGVIT